VLSVLLAWRGSPPRRAASAWYLCRARLPLVVATSCRPAWAACPAPPGTLNLFCFLVSARQPHTHAPLVSRPVCVRGGESGQ
jgi:hypothetical protein